MNLSPSWILGVWDLPDSFPSPERKRPPRCPPASCVDPPAPHWSPYPPGKNMGGGWDELRDPGCKASTLKLLNGCQSGIVSFPIFLPLSLWSGGRPSCQSERGTASTAGSHQAVSQRWRRCSRRGLLGWVPGRAPWPGRTPGLPAGPRSSWSGASGRQERRTSFTPPDFILYR